MIDYCECCGQTIGTCHRVCKDCFTTLRKRPPDSLSIEMTQTDKKDIQYTVISLDAIEQLIQTIERLSREVTERK